MIDLHVYQFPSDRSCILESDRRICDVRIGTLYLDHPEQRYRENVG